MGKKTFGLCATIGASLELHFAQPRSASQVKFILPTCKTKLGTIGKRRKNLRSSKSAALSLNNLKRFTLSSILLEFKIIKRKKNIDACATETKLHKHRITETHVQKKQSYINVKQSIK